MTLAATLSGQTEREPFDAETYFANPDQYDVEYRNGEKPLRVIHVPEEVKADRRVMSITYERFVHNHYENGLYEGIVVKDTPLDLFMRRTDPAESLRGKYLAVHVLDVYSTAEVAEYHAKSDPRNFHIIHLK